MAKRTHAPEDARIRSLRLTNALTQRWKDLHELEQQAGIGDAAARAWDGPLFPLGARSDAPFGSDEWKRISELEDEDEDRYTRRGIRRAYFSVADLDQRKALIEVEREIHSAWQNTVWESVSEAEGKLTAAKHRRARAYEVAAFGGAALVAIGWAIFGLVGAICGTVAAYFLGQQIIEAAVRERQEAIAQAEADLKDANEGYKKALNKAPIFTRSEASTGEADKVPANA